MTIWKPEISGKSGPKFLAIATAIGEDIAAGRLSVGSRLPPQRDLAYDLGVSLNTVTRAYAEAIRLGFIEGEVGRGTYVRASGPLPSETSPAHMMRPSDGPIDFSLNLPSIGEAELALSETLAAIARSNGLASYLDQQQHRDRERHTNAGAAWMRQLGFGVTGDSVILTNGAQQGVFAALLTLLRPGDVLLTEELTYAPIKSMARHLGLKIFPVAMDQDGLVPRELHAACKATKASALYCLPTLHTPTTTTMGEARRREIAGIAQARDLHIIEDDVFGFLPRQRPKPIAAFAPEHTIFVTSVSKCMAPGLRIGYVHAPERLRPALQSAVSMSSWMPPPLMAEIATRWIEDGTAARLNEGQRVSAESRQDMARSILAGHDFQADPSGFHLWLKLPESWRPDSFLASARRRGVELRTSETFVAGRQKAPGSIRLCLGHEISNERVAKGLRTVADLLRQGGDDSELFF